MKKLGKLTQTTSLAILATFFLSFLYISDQQATRKPSVEIKWVDIEEAQQLAKDHL